MFQKGERSASVNPLTYKHRANTCSYHVLKHSVPCLQVAFRLRQPDLTAGHLISSVSQSAIVVSVGICAVETICTII